MFSYLRWNQIDRLSRIFSILGLIGGTTVLAMLVSALVSPPTESDPRILFLLLFPFIFLALLVPVLGVVGIYVAYILFLFAGPVLILTRPISEHTRGIVSFLIFLGSFPWVTGLLFTLIYLAHS